MPQSRYKAVIFDLDGTLLNTLDDLHASVSYALAALSLPPRTKEDIRLAVGDGIANLIARSIEGGKANLQFDAALSLFREHYAQHNTDHTAPYEGILPLLASLHQREIRIGVVSNKIDSAVQALSARYFDGMIDYAVGERDGIRRKPCPDSLLTCIEYLSLSPQDCLYIGDSEQDILTAKNAKVDSLSVTWGFRDAETLIAAGAEALAHSHADILTYLKP